jgi:TetR/AcrR family transcriptional regulator, repressor for neighboring sulfatase
MSTVKRKRTAPAAKDEVRGREAAREAIIAAGRDLFSQKGYAAVSVREIAAQAGVNHGLVHRHFGSKEEVLRAVLQGMFSDVGAVAQAQLDPSSPDFIKRLFPVAAKRKQDWAILMRAVLDGFDFNAAGYQFPITGAVVAHVAGKRGKKDREALERAGAIIAGGIGWLLLEPYLTSVLGLPQKEHDALLTKMASLYQSLA